MNDADQAVRGATARTSRQICFTVAVQAVGIVGVYTFLIFMPLYLETLGLLSRPEALLAGAVATGVSLAAAWPFGALSDRYGRRAVLLAGALAHLICAYPLCLLLGSGKLPWILLAQAVAGVVSAAVAAPGVAMLAEQFPTRFRATGVGLSYSITVSLFGGTTLLVAAALIGATGALTTLAAYLGAVALLSAGAMIGLKSTHKGPLRDFWEPVELPPDIAGYD
jgi:MFS family permease